MTDYDYFNRKRYFISFVSILDHLKRNENEFNNGIFNFLLLSDEETNQSKKIYNRKFFSKSCQTSKNTICQRTSELLLFMLKIFGIINYDQLVLTFQYLLQSTRTVFEKKLKDCFIE